MPTMLTETSIEIASALVESGPDFQRRAIVRDIADAVRFIKKREKNDFNVIVLNIIFFPQLLRVTANLPASLMSSIKGFAAK